MTGEEREQNILFRSISMHCGDYTLMLTSTEVWNGLYQ